MATIKFRVSTKADKSTGKSEILIRFSHGKIDQRAKSNIFVVPEYWNDKTQQIIAPKFRLMTDGNKSVIEELTRQNENLQRLSTFIQQSFIDAGAGKVALPAEWLSQIVFRYNFPEDTTPKSLWEVFDYYIDTRTNISAPRLSHFRSVERVFKRFETYYNMELTFGNITSDTLRLFEDYLSKESSFYKVEGKNWRYKTITYLDSDFERAYMAVPETRLPDPRGKNAISKIMQDLRTFWNWALKKHTSNNPFDDYKIAQCIFGTPFYLTIDERNTLYHFDFSDRPDLAIQRDIFVFQCVIGCRVSDLTSLKKTSIINGAIEYIPRKTKEGKPFIVRVPLNSIAREILERYNNIPGDALLPCHKYDCDYNDDIKLMCHLAGLNRVVTILNPTTREEEKHELWEVASSHIARRCFIGNLYKQVKDPNLVGKLSGHTEGSKAFARYRDIDEDMTKELVSMLEG